MTFWEFLQTPLARLVMGGTALAIFVAVAWWYIKSLREEMHDEGPSANELLDQFRGLRDQGRLSPDEYKEIKSRLGRKLQSELEAARATREEEEPDDPDDDELEDGSRVPPPPNLPG